MAEEFGLEVLSCDELVSFTDMTMRILVQVSNTFEQFFYDSTSNIWVPNNTRHTSGSTVTRSTRVERLQLLPVQLNLTSSTLFFWKNDFARW